MNFEIRRIISRVRSHRAELVALKDVAICLPSINLCHRCFGEGSEHYQNSGFAQASAHFSARTLADICDFGGCQSEHIRRVLDLFEAISISGKGWEGKVHDFTGPKKARIYHLLCCTCYVLCFRTKSLQSYVIHILSIQCFDN